MEAGGSKGPKWTVISNESERSKNIIKTKIYFVKKIMIDKVHLRVRVHSGCT